MFYRPEDGHGLPHNPLKAIVSPRPIAWISTQDNNGVANLAPYSFFNAVADTPPQVMFASTGTKPDQEISKDTVSNIRATGVFCINIVAETLRDAMNASTAALPKEADEFEAANLEAARCETINCPRVLIAPANLECKRTQIVPLEGAANFLVLGQVTGVHMRDEHMVDGRFDVTSYRPLARMGYQDYALVDEVFSLKRPGQ